MTDVHSTAVERLILRPLIYATGTLSSTDPGEREELAASLADWLRKARESGLDQEDIEALYRAGVRESFQESEKVT